MKTNKMRQRGFESKGLHIACSNYGPIAEGVEYS